MGISDWFSKKEKDNTVNNMIAGYTPVNWAEVVKNNSSSYHTAALFGNRMWSDRISKISIEEVMQYKE